MPELDFVLPHWLYWAGLVAFPLVAMFILRGQRDSTQRVATSAPLALFLWLTGGFVGLHRFYLRSRLGFVYIPLFVGILFVNVEIRSARNGISQASNQQLSAEFKVERARKRVKDGREGAQAQLDKASVDLAAANLLKEKASLSQSRWIWAVRALGAAIAALLVFDLFRLVPLTRAAARIQSVESGAVSPAPVAPEERSRHDPTMRVRSRLTDFVDGLNGFAGNFVAYWSAIAVFVYYYEVLARYVFNSPTNWAHESMFLMFGMQYLIAGGYCLREDAHVRVDVIYMRFSDRTKALVDVLTSVFFFIFVVTLLFAGWTFFGDSFQVKEVSFTEWGIQYWPVKLAIPLGAALLLLQGLARLSKDLLILFDKTPPSGSVP